MPTQAKTTPIPAFSITADCPWCGSALHVRHNRKDHQKFIGCSDYPRCDFSCAFDHAVDALARQVRLWQARSRELQHQLDQASAQRHSLPITPQALSRELRKLAGVCHPDRWHGSPFAEEITKHILDWRAKLEGGAL